MKKRIISVLALGMVAITLASCGGGNNKKKADGEPIVLGDSSTIITEHDSNYLRDMVVDLKPNEMPADSSQLAPADSTKKADSATAQAPTTDAPKGTGLTVAFSEVTIFIPNIEVKDAGKQNLKNAGGATYQLTSGKLLGNSLQISGATITRVSQRYQSSVRIKNNLGILELDALGSTAAWKTVNGNKNTYTITGIDENNLATSRITAGTLRDAIRKEARRRRMNRKTQQQWEASVRNVRSAKQKPLEVSLRAVMFKIDGKDKSGKPFSKQVRIDL